MILILFVLIAASLPLAEPAKIAVAAGRSSPYSRWPNGPSTASSFFPLAVWLQNPSHVQEFKKIGINMFVGFYGNLDQASLSRFARGQMPVIPDQNALGLTSPQNKWIQGWHAMDEPDNAQPHGTNSCVPAAKLLAESAAVRAKDPTRPIFLNFGRGVSDTKWIGRGTCTGDTSYYPRAIPAGDIISFDIYPVAEYHGRLEMVANGIDHLKTWIRQAGGSHIIWNVIGAAANGGGPVPTAAQLRAEVWMSLIHGSQGIVYFVDQFSPRFRADGIFNYPTVVRAVKSINAQITLLAPVLNSPTITTDARASSNSSSAPISMMEKQYGGSTYLFAVEMRNRAAVAKFTTPAVSNGVVSVLGENRRIRITNGQFHDSFSAYGVHLYRLAAASASAPNPPRAPRNERSGTARH